MSTTKFSPCGHPVDEFIFNGTYFVCPAIEEDNHVREHCGAILKEKED